MRPAEVAIGYGVERRFVALLAVSAGLHALALAWVTMPPSPLAASPLAVVLNARLRFDVAAAQMPAAQTPAAPARPEARQSPARRELRALPAALETAGPTVVAVAPSAVPTTAAAVAEPAPAVAIAPAVSAAAAPPVAAAPAPADAARLLHGYGQRLSELFARQQQYPRLAALRGWEGEVRVRLSVARQGGLSAVRLERSSGYEVLDRHALAMIEAIGELPPPPAEFSGDVQVVVPIHYRLKKNT